MAQISVPKKFKDFRPLLTKGHIYIFNDIAAIDIKNKTHIYHHQDYMLQCKHNTKVHRLETRGTNIPKFSFNFCPFDNLPEKDTFAKPLQGNTCISFFSFILILTHKLNLYVVSLSRYNRSH